MLFYKGVKEKSGYKDASLCLRDEQWSKIENLLPGRKETVGVTASNNRLFGEPVETLIGTEQIWKEKFIHCA